MDDTFRIAQPDPAQLCAECARAIAQVRAALGSLDADVLEVGSTAIPGVIGKGDLDLLVRVDRDEFVRARAALDGALARNTNQLSNEVYQGYLVESPLDAAVQLTIRGGPYDNFLAFLDALRADAELREEYNALKRRFDGQSMSDYREAKSAFIARVLAAR